MTPEEKMDNVLAKQMAICSIMEQCSWIPVAERLPEEMVSVLVWMQTFRTPNTAWTLVVT